MNKDSEKDLMDSLLEEWQAECPDLNPAAMAIVGRIIRLGRHYEKSAAAALRQFNLSYTDFDIVATLRRRGAPYELTPGELGASVLLTSGAMTAALDRLQNAGLITRHDSSTDRRVKSAKLTQAGKSLAKKAAKARFEAAEAALDNVSRSARQELSDGLKRLQQ